MRSLLLALVGACALVSVGIRVAPAVDRPSVSLHPAVRKVLDTKMEAHALEMTDLVMLVVLLERDDAEKAATRIASEPQIGRPLELRDANAGIPDAFFAYQREMSARADDLADAARDGSDKDMAKAFGDLTEVCVACHSRFLNAD